MGSDCISFPDHCLSFPNPREFVKTPWHRGGVLGTSDGNSRRNQMEVLMLVQGIFDTK